MLPSNHYSPSLTTRPDLLCVLSLLRGLASRTQRYACHSHCCRVFIVWRYNLFIHFTVHGHLSRFYFVAITYRAAVGHRSHSFWSAYGLTQCLAFFFPFLKRCIYFLFLAVGSLRCGMRAFSTAERKVCSPVVVRWLLSWSTGSRAHGLCSCSSWALEQQAE